MNMRAFTIQDLLAETFSFPFPSPTSATAIRFCQEKMNDPSVNLEDFVLWEVTSWNQEVGDYDVERLPRKHVLDLVELKENHGT